MPVEIIGPNTIRITLTDGVFPGDTDGTEDGVITDPGGPGNPIPPAPFALPDYVVGWETSPINKPAVLAPWITLLAAIVGLPRLRPFPESREQRDSYMSIEKGVWPLGWSMGLA